MGLSIALIHYPVLDRLNRVVTTSVTNFDVHDLARAGRTFGVDRYYVVAPVESQRIFVERIVEHWSSGAGAELNITRKEALELVRFKRDVNEIQDDMIEETGHAPLFVATSAQALPNSISYRDLRKRIETESDSEFCLLFGTGHGLTDTILSEVDLMLPPILGPVPWNHLPVRSAASIILDRLRGNRDD